MLRIHFGDDPKRAEEYFPDLYRKRIGNEEPDESGMDELAERGPADAALWGSS